MHKPTAFWDRIARKYSRQPVGDPDSYENTLARTAEHLRETDHVLEIGCGTGTTALRLAKGVARYTATDFSRGMLEIAAEKAAAEESGNLEFVCTSLRDNRLAGQAFDSILAFNLLHLVRDLEDYLNHVFGLLKPGGLFISKTACLRVGSDLFQTRHLGDAAPARLALCPVPQNRGAGNADHPGRF